MFDLSWIELGFCAALALIVVGPKELPGLIQSVRGLGQKARRVYADFLGGVKKLEREIALEDQDGSSINDWMDLLPQDVKDMRASIQPHGSNPEETAEKYRTYKKAVQKAQQDYAALQQTKSTEDNATVP